MTTPAAPPPVPERRVPAPTRRQAGLDALLGVCCLAASVAVHLSGSEAVAANREPDALTVALTVLAVGSIAWRRRFPLTVLVVALASVLGLVLVRGTVGMATIGPLVATYSAVTLGSTRASRRAIALVVLALAVTLVLDPVDLSAGGAVINAGAFAGVILLATSTRVRREQARVDLRAAEQRAAHERQRASLVATQERLRITRELHDVIGHAMSVMVVQAGAAGRLLDTADPARARSAVAEIEHTGRGAMAEMRTLLGVLRDGETDTDGSPRAPVPGLDDVPALVARIEQAGLRTTLAVHSGPVAVSDGVGLAAYRIVQEALTNCLKHSGATCARVELVHRPSELEILVTDDGPGPARGAVEPAAGHGLAGMRERVAAYGGGLTIGGLPGGGFGVRATLPLADVP
jgi:signal transduction histidine kinase